MLSFPFAFEYTSVITHNIMSQNTDDTEEQWITLSDETIKNMGYARKSVVIKIIKQNINACDFRITNVHVKRSGRGGPQSKKYITINPSAYEYLKSKAQSHLSVKEKKKNKLHFLYIIHNPMFLYYGPNVYKVGYSTDVERRVNDSPAFLLEKCTVLYKKQVSSMKDEKKVHAVLKKYRMRPDREFFDCPLELIKQAIDSIV